jgi:hypothetical protein
MSTVPVEDVRMMGLTFHPAIHKGQSNLDTDESKTSGLCPTFNDMEPREEEVAAQTLV